MSDPPRGRSRTLSRYEQIADDLLERINADAFPDGKLPTEDELVATTSASKSTVRAAIKALLDIGVVETQQGRGTFVVKRDLIRINATRTEDLDRRQGVVAQDSWSTDILDAGRTPAQRFECLIVTAGKRAAEHLGCAADDALIMRRCWRTIDGIPAAVETSVFPQWLVQELPHLAHPQDIPQGTTSYLADNGYPSLHHRDSVSARPFTRDEATFFDSAPGLGALVRVRLTSASDGRALRLMDSVYRSDMTEVVYDVPGRGNCKDDPKGPMS
jgi:GntR family transcriptional regulator